MKQPVTPRRLKMDTDAIRAQIRADDERRRERRAQVKAAKHFTVKTRDVDGTSTKRFATMKGAREHFERMCGLTMEQVITEIFTHSENPPTAETVHRLEGVSKFGTIVTFLNESIQKPTTPEPVPEPTPEVVPQDRPAPIAPEPVSDTQATKAAEAAAALFMAALREDAIVLGHTTEEAITAYIADQMAPATKSSNGKAPYIGPMLILREAAKTYVRGLHCGDDIASRLDGMKEVIEFVRYFLVSHKVEVNSYAHLNRGQQSMNLRNRLRAAHHDGLISLQELDVAIAQWKENHK